MTRRVLLLILRGFGTGYTPGMPGTAGSLLALLMTVPILSRQPNLGRETIFLILLSLSLGTSIITWLGFKRLHDEWEEFDPGDIVLDEFAGTFLVMGLTALSGSVLLMVAGFVLFRVFDILKPPPIPRIERSGRFAGLVADDLAAALMATFVIALLWWFHDVSGY